MVGLPINEMQNVTLKTWYTAMYLFNNFSTFFINFLQLSMPTSQLASLICLYET